MELSMTSLKRSLDSICSSSSSTSTSDLARPRKRRHSIHSLKRSLERSLVISRPPTSCRYKRRRGFLPSCDRYDDLDSSTDSVSQSSVSQSGEFLLDLGTDLLTRIAGYIWDELSSLACISSWFSSDSFAKRLGVSIGFFSNDIDCRKARAILLSGANLLHTQNIGEASRLDYICVVRPLTRTMGQGPVTDSLWKAISLGNTGSALAILQSPGFDIHCFNEKPLLVAVTFGQIELVKFLISSGADVKAGGSPLLKAAVRGTFKQKVGGPMVLKELLEAGDSEWKHSVMSETLRYCTATSGTNPCVPDVERDTFDHMSLVLRNAEAEPEVYTDAMLAD